MREANETGPERAGGPDSPLELLKLLADETRWRLLGELRRSDRQVGELVERLGLSQNLISYHLGILRQAGLVAVHRSDADARANYYSLDVGALEQGYRQLGQELRIVAGAAPLPPATVIFLCRANSARSQMAEGWLRHLSGGRLIARSAGTAPRPVHPLAIQVMAEAGIDIGHQLSKGFDALADLRPDIVVTVCDIAREECPAWLDSAPHLHWSIADPAHGEADSAAQLLAFRAARDELRQRVSGLLALLPNLV